jgi:hypothetical protein
MMRCLSVFLLMGKYLAAVTSSMDSISSEFETLEADVFVGGSTVCEDEWKLTSLTQMKQQMS